MKLSRYQRGLLEQAARDPEGFVRAPRKATTAMGGSSNASFSRSLNILIGRGLVFENWAISDAGRAAIDVKASQ